MSALDAARLNMQRAGHDLSLLEGLALGGKLGQLSVQAGRRTTSAVEAATELLSPLAVGGRGIAQLKVTLVPSVAMPPPPVTPNERERLAATRAQVGWPSPANPGDALDKTPLRL